VYKPWHIKSKEIDEMLYRKAIDFMKRKKIPRRPLTKDIFNRLTYIGPEDIKVINWIRKTPVSVFNPGAVLMNKRILIFPRIIFGYYYYSSCIGVMELNIDEVIEGNIGKPVPTKIVIYPTEPWEMALGCEDARVSIYDDTFYVLYTGVAHRPERLWRRPLAGVSGYIGLQALALMDLNYNVKSKQFFKIKRYDKIHIPDSWRDTAFVRINSKSSLILTRPTVNDVSICWRAILDMNELAIEVDSLEPNLCHEEWEIKIGWSTNVVKLSSNEYLVGWHGVSNIDGFYREGLAIVDDQGELLAITPHYILSPKGLDEVYGDRPGVIFGNGLIAYKDILLWIGGISDHAIGIFSTSLDKALESLTWLR